MNILYVNSLEANNKELARQLASANVLIAEQNKLGKERQEWALHTSEVIRSLNQQLAAEQAKNVELRDALNRLQEAGNGEYDNEFYAANSAATKTLSAPSDTSALEAMIAKAGEKMREKAEDEFSNPFRDTVFKWDAAIDIIRTLPGVTLEDLK